MRRIVDKPHPLSFHMDFALANSPEPICQNAHKVAAAGCGSANDIQFVQALDSDPDLVRVCREMNRISKRILLRLWRISLLPASETAIGLLGHRERRRLRSTNVNHAVRTQIDCRTELRPSFCSQAFPSDCTLRDGKCVLPLSSASTPFWRFSR